MKSPVRPSVLAQNLMAAKSPRRRAISTARSRANAYQRRALIGGGAPTPQGGFLMPLPAPPLKKRKRR
jgi:hypothetical protein